MMAPRMKRAAEGYRLEQTEQIREEGLPLGEIVLLEHEYKDMCQLVLDGCSLSGSCAIHVAVVQRTRLFFWMLDEVLPDPSKEDLFEAMLLRGSKRGESTEMRVCEKKLEDQSTRPQFCAQEAQGHLFLATSESTWRQKNFTSWDCVVNNFSQQNLSPSGDAITARNTDTNFN